MAKNEFLRERPGGGGGGALKGRMIGWAATVLAGCIIFIGLWYSTQSFAELLEYDVRWCGKPVKVIRKGDKLQPVYSPFAYFGWCIKYISDVRMHPYMERASFPLKAGGACALLVFVALSILRMFVEKSDRTYGTARWARKKDIKELLSGKGGVVLGETGAARVDYKYDDVKQTYKLTLKKPGDVLTQAGVVNVFLAAPTRSGKGVSCVIPTLLTYPNSMVVLDFKGENFNLTSGFRSKLGPIYRYSPVGDGSHFNPMMEIRPGKDAYSDANLIADILTTPAGGESGGNSEHFRTGAKELLTGAILHCLCCLDWKDKTLPGVIAFLAQSDPEPDVQKRDPKYVYRLMANGRHCDPEIHEKVRIVAEHQISRPDNEQGSMLSTVNNALSVFMDSNVCANHSDSDFYIDDFRRTERPITLYMTIPYDALERIQPLIRMFIIFMTRKFSGGETNANERALKIPILFLLDEFDKLGKYEELHKGVGIFAGYGIHFFFICQSINQVVQIYGKENSFLEHCFNMVSYAPGNGGQESAKLISELCGKDSFYLSSTSFSGQGLSSMNVSGSEHERQLINPDEAMKLPGDQMLLFTTGKPPYIGKKVVYYMDERFKPRLLPAVFKSRAEALRKYPRKGRPERWFDEVSEVLLYEDEAAVIEEGRSVKPTSFGVADNKSAAAAVDNGGASGGGAADAGGAAEEESVSIFDGA